jgi:hypothetical protein
MVDTSADPKLARRLLQSVVDEGGTATLEALMDQFSGHDRYRDVVPALKLLQEQGKGKFVVGRKKHPSRFICDDRVLTRHQVKSESDGTDGDEDASRVRNARSVPPVGFLSHSFPLRRSLVVSLRLPTDITKAEAERLSQFILSIPIA